MTRKPPDTPPVRRQNRLRPLGLAIAAVAKPLVGRKGFTEVDILTRWAEIVSPEVAAYTLPLRIAKPRAGAPDGPTLHVRVASSAFATVLKHQEPQLCARINSFFGFPAVARIKTAIGKLPPPPTPRPVPVPPPPLPQDESALVNTVTDPELREALDRLGRQIRVRNPSSGG